MWVGLLANAYVQPMCCPLCDSRASCSLIECFKSSLLVCSGYSCVCQPGFHLTVNYGGQITCAECPLDMVRLACEANVSLLNTDVDFLDIDGLHWYLLFHNTCLREFFWFCSLRCRWMFFVLHFCWFFYSLFHLCAPIFFSSVIFVHNVPTFSLICNFYSSQPWDVCVRIIFLLNTVHISRHKVSISQHRVCVSQHSISVVHRALLSQHRVCVSQHRAHLPTAGHA